jgi:hypothetical protein
MVLFGGEDLFNVQSSTKFIDPEIALDVHGQPKVTFYQVK